MKERILLKKFGGAVFRRAFYEEPKEKRVELLKELQNPN